MHPTRAARPLAALLREAGIESALPASAAEVGVGSIESDSRAVTPGSLFVAITGMRVDGHQFIAEAIRRGAAAVVAERIPGGSAGTRIPVIAVGNSRLALSDLAAAFYDHPSRGLCVVGITGTDGKTTTATLLWRVW